MIDGTETTCLTENLKEHFINNSLQDWLTAEDNSNCEKYKKALSKISEIFFDNLSEFVKERLVVQNTPGALYNGNLVNTLTRAITEVEIENLDNNEEVVEAGMLAAKSLNREMEEVKPLLISLFMFQMTRCVRQTDDLNDPFIPVFDENGEPIKTHGKFLTGLKIRYATLN